MDSILNSTKKFIGIFGDYNHFDADLIFSINTVFSVLNQLGVGPKEGFSIKDDTAIWTDFIDDYSTLEDVKTYVFLKTRLIFDPPSNSIIEGTINRLISELEWRLNVEADDTWGD